MSNLNFNAAKVAPAVAHYLTQGFSTFETMERNERWMRNTGTEKVCIKHYGLLDVVATKYKVIPS